MLKLQKFFYLLLFCFIISGVCFSAPPVKQVINGWKNGRAKLENGVVSIEIKDVKKSGSEKSNIKLSFDYVNNYYMGSSENGKGRVGLWLYNGDWCAHCVKEQKIPLPPVLDIGLVGSRKLSFVKNIDLRSVSFLLLGEFHTFPPFDEIVSRIVELGEGKIEEVDQKLYLTWENNKGPVPRKITATIDPNKDFACEEMRFFAIPPGEKNYLLGSSSKTTWISKDIVWVPESIRIEDGNGSSVEASFVWEKINCLEKTDFSIGNMGVDKGTLVLDRRLSTENPIELGRFGESFEIPRLPLFYRVLYYFSQLTLVLIALSLFLAGGLFYLLRMRKAGNAK